MDVKLVALISALYLSLLIGGVNIAAYYTGLRHGLNSSEIYPKVRAFSATRLSLVFLGIALSAVLPALFVLSLPSFAIIFVPMFIVMANDQIQTEKAARKICSDSQ